MSLLIRKAKENEISDILDIYDSCTKYLLSKGMDYWVGVNEKEGVTKEVLLGQIFVGLDRNEIIGVVKISYKEPWYYDDDVKEFWKDSKAKVLYFGGLGVKLEYHGKGFGIKLLDFIEKEAKNLGAKYVRFDSVQHDTKLVQFYKNRGYEIVGSRNDGNPLFYFYEKLLG